MKCIYVDIDTDRIIMEVDAPNVDVCKDDLLVLPDNTLFKCVQRAFILKKKISTTIQDLSKNAIDVQCQLHCVRVADVSQEPQHAE